MNYPALAADIPAVAAGVAANSVCGLMKDGGVLLFALVDS